MSTACQLLPEQLSGMVQDFARYVLKMMASKLALPLKQPSEVNLAVQLMSHGIKVCCVRV